MPANLFADNSEFSLKRAPVTAAPESAEPSGSTGTTLQTRLEVSEENTWNLNPMYVGQEAWESDFKQLETLTLALAALEGTLGASAKSLKDAFELSLRISRLLDKVYTYAHLRSDQDTGNSQNLGLLDRSQNLATRVSAASGYFSPELLAIPAGTLHAYLAEPELKQYRRAIEEIVRYRPHTLGASEETLLAGASETFSASSKTFSQLTNADFDFGKIVVKGEEHLMTHGSYMQILRKPDRDIRKAAYERYYSVYDQHRHTIASTLGASIKKNVFLARSRKFNSAVERSLFSDDVPLNVYETLVNTVSANLDPLHRYYAARKKILKIDTTRLYDTHVPVVSGVQTSISYGEAAELTCQSLTPLGDEYVGVLRKGLTTERWVDRHENKGKRSGAYSSGCYDSSPYILMNYNSENLRDLFTLTHEAGHSMHSYFSTKHQPFQDYGYTIFVAEVASTFNEQLLLRSLQQKHKDDKQMLSYLINHQIDEIKGTLFRQTMFAEFELETHRAAERNEPLTVDVLRAMYRKLLVKYFGDAIELMPVDDLECLRIPHFYSAFYVYKYATGISAAIALSERVLNGGKAELDAYLNFLRSGGSKYPLELLKDAGVDLTTAAPIEAAMKLFTSLVNTLEALQ